MKMGKTCIRKKPFKSSWLSIDLWRDKYWVILFKFERFYTKEKKRILKIYEVKHHNLRLENQFYGLNGKNWPNITNYYLSTVAQTVPKKASDMLSLCDGELCKLMICKNRKQLYEVNQIYSHDINGSRLSC